jgi:hypothetical protein
MATDNLYHYEARTGLCYRSIRTRTMTTHAINLKWLGTGLGLVLSCLGFVATLRCEAQNLVPNPSFEEFDTCRVVNDVYYPEIGPLGWFSAAGTPDHFMSCLPYGSFNGVPLNAWSFQYPQDGECYAGVVTYREFPEVREYMMIQLTEPLVVGQQYFASFYASAAWGGYTPTPQLWLATSGIGMVFTTQQRQWELNNPYPAPLNYAHVYSEAIVSDTVGWTLVSGTFVADSAYQYLMLGNPFNNASTDTLHFVNETSIPRGMALIDNVQVYSDPTGIVERSVEGAILHPNPASLWITLAGIASGTRIRIHDTLGRGIWNGSSTGEDFRLEVDRWARGTYVLHLEDAGKRKAFKFVLVE